LIVVDTNLLVYAVLPGEGTAMALRVAARDADWVAPPLWRYELANVLATWMRVRGLTSADAVDAFSEAERLVVDAELTPSLERKLDLAARGKVSAYDAEFVALAQELDLPLVTADRRLSRAFPKSVLLVEDFVDD
jgi:predicted nucleic acid-binding protein